MMHQRLRLQLARGRPLAEIREPQCLRLPTHVADRAALPGARGVDSSHGISKSDQVQTRYDRHVGS